MPPGVAGGWDDIDVWTQAKLIAYEQTRSYEENDPGPKSPKKPSTKSRPKKGKKRRKR